MSRWKQENPGVWPLHRSAGSPATPRAAPARCPAARASECVDLSGTALPRPMLPASVWLPWHPGSRRHSESRPGAPWGYRHSPPTQGKRGLGQRWPTLSSRPPAAEPPIGGFPKLLGTSMMQSGFMNPPTDGHNTANLWFLYFNRNSRKSALSVGAGCWPVWHRMSLRRMTHALATWLEQCLGVNHPGWQLGHTCIPCHNLYFLCHRRGIQSLRTYNSNYGRPHCKNKL